MSLQKDSVIECTIESLAYGGRGVGRVDGMAVFVAGGLPGDTVTARVIKAKKRFAEAVLEEIVTPSEHRVEPQCPHFGTCGGCTAQDLDYAEQLAQKGSQVENALSRIGGLDNVAMDAPVASPAIWRYRNKMEFAFEQQDGKLCLGLRAIPAKGERLGRVLEMEECHICAVRDLEIMNFVRDFCAESNVVSYHPPTDTGFWRHLVLRHTSIGQVQVHLITTADERKYNLPEELGDALVDRFPEVVSYIHSIRNKRSTIAYGEEMIYRLGHKFVEERLPKGEDNVRYHLAQNTFFQTNTGGASELFSAISEFGEFSGHETILDLYCGAGAIGIYLADEVGHVVGYEINEEAIGKAWASAKLNRINNCEFHNLSLESGIEGVEDLPTPDAIIVDPPRSGMQEKTAKSILRLAPKKIIAVSCDPSTLARDVKRLSGKYEVKRVRAVDMFPHTHHIETVALLVKK
ncbi:23S rRNA (uracil(1939)-C(5))-methyltransferase RlmD [Pseudodesulfovibrio sp. zrk46]|uniref:23S rRNA (uracil(1939)-C(5))-methyltransferase RlmD n=1 Tax=Pseudodesulfovibrio sp. zrk46 TaxID=2725288 RepID=UPI0014495FB1|nr:23S rRNA (uracil(1939)-C(5))-methyltransferase RlmD [Pseudodesulfovibrio sp. zrk46]QJB55387.1 23S rRNA (uracil(1939)-C(5))-methyltransferase RlmD [Pseudodesulfovibrio sp. zrk46]